MQSTPPIHPALAGLIALIDERIRLSLCAPKPPTYSQLDGQRPPGVGRTRYLRAWRRGRDAGDPEAIADGRARLMTPGAWARHGATTSVRSMRPAKPSAVSLRDDVLSELGLATRRAS